ncbi:MAG TPA: T9SS type A sorting domain-containing protein, partial [Bacteroidales bacterium]|nr:T9SS type A sorting domain-containing protein [Bacteroidales bacterium]
PLTNLDFTTLGVTYQQALYNYITSSKAAVITAVDYPEGGNGRILNMTQQNVQAQDGWSLISGYIEPSNNDVAEVMKKLVNTGDLEIMVSFNGIYWPAQNINTFTNGWGSETAYKIKMNNGNYFILKGVRTDNTVVTLNAGVSYLPVPVAHPVDANNIFSQVQQQLVYAFDLNSGAIYWPQGGIFTLTQLVPGNGYIISMSAPGSIDFAGFKSSVIAENKGSFKQTVENTPWETQLTGNYHLIAIMNEAMDQMESGDVVALFNNSGDFAGQVMIEKNGDNIALVAFGDDVTTEEQEGLLIGETMNFRLFRPATGETFDLSVEFNNSMPNTNLFYENGASMITDISLGVGSTEDVILTENISVHPNPSNGHFTITSDLSSASKMVMVNAIGQKVYEKHISDDQKNQSFTVDVSSCPSGIYFIKVFAGTKTLVQKVIID